MILLILIYFKRELVNKNYIFLLIFVPVILAGNYLYFTTQKQLTPHNNEIKNIILRKNHENFSSNRFNIWHKVIEESKKNNFLGYGFQADRKIINESAHNVYIYALICGGILSVILIILISLRSAWISFLIIFNYIFLNKKYSSINIISAFLMMLFLQRSLLETSYGIYSIDYLFFITCFFINELNYRKSLSR
jgi:O-antigen ligase